jgi:deoxyhypusine synthase
MKNQIGPISKFIEDYYLHFNAGSLSRACKSLKKKLEEGNKLFISLSGAFSTAEGGKILAQLIKEDKVHAICCTGANIEESLFDAVAHKSYVMVPDYQFLTPKEEKLLEKKGLNRVTDTCIPEGEAIDKIADKIYECWVKVWENGEEGKLWHEYFYDLFRFNLITAEDFDIPLEDCWIYEAYKKNLPIFVPGCEDSTLGNMFASSCYKEEMESWVVLNGMEYMIQFYLWYESITKENEVMNLVLGGGIAGDFIQCGVPSLIQDLEIKVPFWSLIMHVTDATETYGGYSGCQIKEKISWGKADLNTERFLVNSDYTIVFPLIGSYLLNK